MPKYSLPIIQEIRAVKSSGEVRNIVQAQRTSETVLAKALTKLRVGVTEIAIARFIVSEFFRRGARALAFEPIVGFGKGTADIHHEPGGAKLKRGDTVMFDIGCTVRGYCSDMTRTYFFGTPTVRQIRMYAAVLEAQERALRALAQGERRSAKVDARARQYLHKRFGRKAFAHGLGHGIGTVIHEWPNFRPTSPDILPTGAVVTVEPGVYKRGWGGVRIEDLVLINRRGVTNLTKMPKTLDTTILHVR